MPKSEDRKLKAIYKVLDKLMVADLALKEVKNIIIERCGEVEYENASNALFGLASDFLKASEKIVKKPNRKCDQ